MKLKTLGFLHTSLRQPRSLTFDFLSLHFAKKKTLLPLQLTGTLSGYLLRILADSTHRCSERERQQTNRKSEIKGMSGARFNTEIHKSTTHGAAAAAFRTKHQVKEGLSVLAAIYYQVIHLTVALEGF